jgi:hypothetical protein
MHLALTILIVMLITWSVDLVGMPRQVEDMVIPAVILLFVARALWFVYQESGSTILEQETERERYNDLDEKPKRRLAVGDDGELTEIVYDEDAWEEKPKRAE